MDLTLTITAFNKITFIGTVAVQPSTGAYVQVDEQLVSDNNNNLPDYGETVQYNLALNNVGTEAATNVLATISSTDAYITITDNTAEFGTIPAGETVTSTNGYTIQIANNVPDQHVAPIHVIVNQNGLATWQYDLNLILNAPAFTVGSMQISDIQGNNNGRLDAGETVTLTIPVTNSGHSAAVDFIASMLVNNPVMYLLNPIQTSFSAVAANETVSAVFELTFSSQVPNGTLAQLMLMAVAGEYLVIQDVSTYIGLSVESFDNGNFTVYPWTFTGGEWTVDNTTFHSPVGSAKSAVINHNGTTTMTVTMNIAQPGNILFWKKVSSEATYDFLKFYINDVLKNSWSGEVDWTQETFAVTAGANTFKWLYMKDSIVSSGSDCAWVDDITFPSDGGSTGTPDINLSTTSIDFGSHTAADFTSQPFTIANNGDATLIGTITGTPVYQVKPAQATEYAQSASFVIPAGHTLNFDLMIFPPQPGTYNAALNIISDDPESGVSVLNVSSVVLPTASDDNHAGYVTALRGNFPNPFNPETTVSFSLKQAQRVTVEIYNLLGQRVKTLVNEELAAGNHTYQWNGKDDAGHSAGSGIYFLKMRTGAYSATTKMVMMK